MKTYLSTTKIKVTNLTLSDIKKHSSFFANYLSKNQLSNNPEFDSIKLIIKLMFPNADKLEQFFLFKAIYSNNKYNRLSVRETFPHIILDETYRKNKSLLKQLDIPTILSECDLIEKYRKIKEVV